MTCPGFDAQQPAQNLRRLCVLSLIFERERQVIEPSDELGIESYGLRRKQDTASAILPCSLRTRPRLNNSASRGHGRIVTKKTAF